MYIFITILIIVVSILLMLIVLVQNPKGGGLGAGFGGGASSAMGGVKQTSDFLEKATWSLVIALFVLSIVSAGFMSDGDTKNSTETKIENILNND